MRFIFAAFLILASSSASALPQKVCESYANMVAKVAEARDTGITQKTNSSLMLMAGKQAGQNPEVTNAMVDFVYANPQVEPVSLGLKFYGICTKI